jgi:integrase
MSDRRKCVPNTKNKHQSPTLGDVRDAVQNSAALSPTRRRDLLSAISCFCDLTGKDENAVALDLTAIAGDLGAINPAARGISAKRLAIIRSDLLAAIAASGLKPVRTSRQTLSDPWMSLWGKLKTKRQRIGLSRLSHYASAAGLITADIDDDVIASFISVIREQSLHRKPSDLHRQTTVIWNEIVSAFPELGLSQVSVPSFRAAPRRIALPTLPECFNTDLEAYMAWCTSPDPFAADARPRAIAPSTAKLRRDQIHAAVTALVESGVDPANITSLADLVSVANFRLIATRRFELAERKENAFNRGIAGTLVQIAKEWVGTKTKAKEELKRMARKLQTLQGDLTAKNKRFLRQFDDPATLRRLRILPAQLWSQVRRDKQPNFRTLSLAQAALGLEILIYMPIRMQNLARLEFDRHLFLKAALGAVSTLEIPPEEVKNKRPIGFDIPPHIIRMLIEYRDHIAPKVLGRKPDRLFVNPDGTPKLAQTVSKLIQRIVRRYAGIDLSPHQLRHLAAKVLLDDSPGAFELVKQLLGHENLKTTVNAYTGIDTRRACNHHYRLLEKFVADQPLSLRRTGRGRKKKKPAPKDENE